MHQSYVISEIGHLYGSGSPEHVAVKAGFGALHDSSLSYRVAYGFRNAIVHSSRRTVTSLANSHLVVDSDGQERTVGEVELRLVREAFAKTKPNAKLRAEVLALQEDPELLFACRSAWEDTKSLHIEIEPLLYPTRGAAVQTLWGYLVETAALGGYGPYFNSVQTKGPLPPGMQMVPVTRAVVDYVWKIGMAEALSPPWVLLTQTELSETSE